MFFVRVLVVGVCVWCVGVVGVAFGDMQGPTVKAGLNCETNKYRCDWILSRREPTPPLGSRGNGAPAGGLPGSGGRSSTSSRVCVNQNPSGTGSKPGAVGDWTDARYAQMLANGGITNGGPPTHATDLPASLGGGSGSRGLGDRGGSVDVGVPESGGIGSPGLPGQITQPERYVGGLISAPARRAVANKPSQKHQLPPPADVPFPRSSPSTPPVSGLSPTEERMHKRRALELLMDASLSSLGDNFGYQTALRLSRNAADAIQFLGDKLKAAKNPSEVGEISANIIAQQHLVNANVGLLEGYIKVYFSAQDRETLVESTVELIRMTNEVNQADYTELYLGKIEEVGGKVLRDNVENDIKNALKSDSGKGSSHSRSSLGVPCSPSAGVAAAEVLPSSSGSGSSVVGVLSQGLVSGSGLSGVGVRVYGRDIDRLGEVFSSKGLLVGRCDEGVREVPAGGVLRVDLGSLCDWKGRAVSDVAVSLVKGSEVKDLPFREKALAYASGFSVPLIDEVIGRPWWAEAMIDPAGFPAVFSGDHADKPAFGVSADRVEIDKGDGVLEYQASKNDVFGEDAVVLRFTDTDGQTRVVTVPVEVTDHSPVCDGVARDLVDRYGVKRVDGLDTGGIFSGEISDDRLVVERGSSFRSPVGGCVDVDDDVVKEVFSGSDSDLLKPSAGKDENGDPGVVFGVPSDRVGSVGDVRVQAEDEGGREARVSVPVVVKDVPYVCQTTKGRLVVHVVPGVEKHVDVPCALKNGVRPLAVVKSQFGVFEDRSGVFRTDISQVTGAVSFDVSVNQGVVGTVTRSLTLFNGDLRTSVPVDLVVDDGTQSSQAGSGSSSGSGGSGGKYAPPMDSPGPSSPVPPVSGDGKTGGGSSVPSSSGGKKPVKGEG